MKKTFLAVLLSGTWISLSEFIRNELIFKHYWIEHFKSLGLNFPSETINNAMWGLWSFILAGLIVFLVTRLKKVETITVTWIFSFLCMWIVMGNLNVLPFKLLVFAVPLSLLEVFIAELIARKIIIKK